MKTKAMDIVEGLLAIEAISINIANPFIWASGIQAPIYCDNRKSLGHYALRRKIAAGLSEAIKTNFPEVEIIGGTATAGIPHATSVADTLALPLVYFRSTQKAHGTRSTIEGDFIAGQKIVIVEDLISTGGSVLKCVEHAKAHELDVLGVVSIVNYGLKEAVERFDQEQLAVISLISFSEIYQVLALGRAETDFIDMWQQNPYNSNIWDELS